MRFRELRLPGAYVIEPEAIRDKRGSFARTFCRNEFRQHSLETEIVQVSIALNEKVGTLRGLHFQLAPKSETKLITCIKGAARDVILDLRPRSKTYCEWEEIELSEENRKLVYVPQGFAHGYETLSPNTVLSYHMFNEYSAEHASGVRWNDPAFGIRWKTESPVISDRDSSFPDYSR